MEYTVKLGQVNHSYLAAIRTTANNQNLSAKIREILTASEVYKFIKDEGLEKTGHNLIIYYRDAENKTVPNHIREFVIEVGVQVARPFKGDDRVICSTTPQGTVATVLHTGPYDRLGKAHIAILNWCKENDHSVTGLNWEIYGDWEEDPNKLLTEVFYLLK
jgi:effector-binding domain-containing protein